MQQKTKQVLSVGFALVFLIAVLFGLGRLAVTIWRSFMSLNPNVAVGLLTAITTITVATGTITLGRYFERKKEVEAHFRQRKSEIYHSFLVEFFSMYYTSEQGTPDLTEFLRQWQTQGILWGGSKVLRQYLTWVGHLKTMDEPDARAMFLMDDFLRALRRDLGLSNRGLEQGAFVRMVLRHPEVFFAMVKLNPNVKLSEVSKREKELGLES